MFDPNTLASHAVAAACVILTAISFFFGKAWTLTVAFASYGYMFSRFEHTAFSLWYCCLLYICHVAFHLAEGRPWLRWLHRNVLQRMLIWTTPGVLFAHHDTISITGWTLNAVQILLGMGLIIHELGSCVPWLRSRNALRWKWLLLLVPLSLSFACWSVCVWNEHATIAVAEEEAARRLGLSTTHAGFITSLGSELPPVLPPALSSLESSLAKNLVKSGIHPLAAEIPVYLVAKAMQSFDGPRQVVGSSVTVLYCEIDLWLEEADAKMSWSDHSSRAQSAGDLRKRQQIGCGRPRTMQYSISKPRSGDTNLDSAYAAILSLERDIGNLVLDWQNIEAEYTELYHRLTSTLNALDALCAKHYAGGDIASWFNNAHAIPCSPKDRPGWLPLPLPECVAGWSVGTPYGFGAWWHLFRYIFTPSEARRLRKSQGYLHDAIVHATKQLQKVQDTTKALNTSRIPESASSGTLPGTLQWRLAKIEEDQQLAHTVFTDQMSHLFETFAHQQNSDAIACVAASLMSGNRVYGHFVRSRTCIDMKAKGMLGVAKAALEVPQSDRTITR